MYKFIDGQKARFWSKFYYVNSDGFIVSKVGGKKVDYEIGKKIFERYLESK